MKVLIFAAYFHPHKGGYENHIYQFAEKLAEKKVSVTILTTNTNNSKEYERVNSFFDIYRIPVWNALNGTYPIPKFNKRHFKILGNLSKKKWDLVITQTRFFTTSYIGYKFAKLNKIPLVHVEHGSCHTVTNNKFVGIVNRIYDHTLGSTIVKKSRLNVGISNGACNFVKHLGGKEAVYIPNGVKEVKINYVVRKEIREIIFVGRLIYAKGVQDLINAFSQIDNKRILLTIVGNGPYKKDLENLMKNFKLESKVKFVGEKDNAEVMKLLSQSDLFVNPSYSEGLPTSVLEAGAVGLPVIATDVGGTKEVIINRKTGLLVKEKDIDSLKNAIEFMISHQAERANYAKSLKRHVKEKFEWGKLIETWMKILKNQK